MAGKKAGRAELTGKAAALLEAQVEYLLAELSGERLVELLERDVLDLLDIADALVLAEVVDVEQVKRTAHTLVERIGGSSAVETMVTALSDALYDLGASDEYDLADVVDRAAVSALIARLLGMRTLHDRAMERMTESPLAATIATKFVGQIVADFVAQNRQSAEKIPGAASLFSLGQSVASRAKSVSDRALGGFVDGATERGAQMALKRTNNAIRELLRDPQMHAAAMELWDLHADEPVSGLRTYLSKKELRELALLIHALVISGRDGDYAHEVLDAGIDAFFAEYGGYSLAALLPELGLTPDQLTADLQAFAPPIVGAALATGKLEALLRSRLEPFFASPAVAAIVGE
ncbi:MAG: hypothetical protein JWQ77_1116 [Jatrophihabitans sp.]|nr:hypothetical protein [Jatrophihabitans sp.]